RGKWTYPGGFVDWGEAVEAAAVRETREETGLEVELDGLLGVYSYPGTPIVIVVYRARVIGGEVRTCWENDCVEWVAPDDIPWEQLAFPSTTEALRAFLNGKDPQR
ncbi:MAG TPA: NUDIX domain-containing protein, partial [Methylomirabilota bacterium]|nr:NUDIX domain-containing protein [Methylomirabilota bacterium]